MNVPFTKAFEAWETEFRANPAGFMTTDEMAAVDVLPLSEQRSAYFVAILNKLADGQPWGAIT
jgi:hypothetical protein